MPEREPRVEQRWVLVDEAVEIHPGPARVSRMRDDADPEAAQRLVVLLRHPVPYGDVAEEGRDPRQRPFSAVAGDCRPREMDVLAVTEPPLSVVAGGQSMKEGRIAVIVHDFLRYRSNRFRSIRLLE